MGHQKIINIDEICPYIRKAGTQTQSSWKNRFRKIYDYELFYCSKGKATLAIEDRQYNLSSGKIALIKPNTPHNLSIDEKQPPTLYWVHFDFLYRKDVYDLENMLSKGNDLLYDEILPLQHYIREEFAFDNGFTFPECIQIDETILMKKTFQKLLFEYESHNPLWQIECKIHLLHMLKLIIHQSLEGAYAKKSTRNISALVVQYIYKNYSRKITLKELSYIAGLSEDHLGKVFKKEVGISITQFITKLRLKHAKELLLNTDLTIENIAEMVGYNDIYYFSKVMKKHEGVSPSAWRKLMKNQ